MIYYLPWNIKRSLAEYLCCSILSSFTYPSKLYEKIFWRMLVTKQMTFIIWKKNTMKVNGYCQLFGYQHSSKYRLLCSAEEINSYRFGTTWGWVNDDRIFIFWVNYPFKLCHGFVIIILYLMNLPTFIADCIVMSKTCNVFTFGLTIDDI